MSKPDPLLKGKTVNYDTFCWLAWGYKNMKSFQKNKTLRLRGKAYTKFRKEVHDHYNGMCAKCCAWSPLMINGVFDIWTCGHVSHVKSRGAGGNDTLDNVQWLCYNCHTEHHGPKWRNKR